MKTNKKSKKKINNNKTKMHETQIQNIKTEISLLNTKITHTHDSYYSIHHFR